MEKLSPEALQAFHAGQYQTGHATTRSTGATADVNAFYAAMAKVGLGRQPHTFLT